MTGVTPPTRFASFRHLLHLGDIFFCNLVANGFFAHLMAFADDFIFRGKLWHALNTLKINKPVLIIIIIINHDCPLIFPRSGAEYPS